MNLHVPEFNIASTSSLSESLFRRFFGPITRNAEFKAVSYTHLDVYKRQRQQSRSQYRALVS